MTIMIADSVGAIVEAVNDFDASGGCDIIAKYVNGNVIGNRNDATVDEDDVIVVQADDHDDAENDDIAEQNTDEVDGAVIQLIEMIIEL